MYTLHAKFKSFGLLLFLLFAGRAGHAWGHPPAPSLRIPLEQTQNVHKLAFSPDGRELAAVLYDAAPSGGSYRVVFFHTGTGQVIRQWKSERVPGRSLAFSPDAQVLAVGGPDFVALLSRKTGVILQKLAYPPHQNSHQDVDVGFSPDGKIVAAVEPSLSQIVVWDVASARCLWVRRGAPQEFFGLYFSPNSELLASGGWGQRVDRSLNIWDARRGVLKYSLRKPVPLEAPVVFSTEGRTLVSSGDSCLLTWRFETGTTRRIPKPPGFCAVLGFSKSGNRLISWGQNAPPVGARPPTRCDFPAHFLCRGQRGAVPWRHLGRL